MSVTETSGLLPDAPLAAGELAGRLARLAAVLIDALMGLIPGVAALAYSGGLEPVLKGQGLTTQQALLVAGWSWGSFFAINSYLLFKRGQTIGKYLLAVRIVDLQGRIAPLWRVIVLRYVLISVVGQLGVLGSVLSTVDCLLIFQKSRRCLHDILAGTRVIKARP
jgi:uncharacterized RDD family membrane protein YckC